jgi:hypothetical protein
MDGASASNSVFIALSPWLGMEPCQTGWKQRQFSSLRKRNNRRCLCQTASSARIKTDAFGISPYAHGRTTSRSRELLPVPSAYAHPRPRVIPGRERRIEIHVRSRAPATLKLGLQMQAAGKLRLTVRSVWPHQQSGQKLHFPVGARTPADPRPQCQATTPRVIHLRSHLTTYTFTNQSGP